jgi:hypothetical protein
MSQMAGNHPPQKKLFPKVETLTTLAALFMIVAWQTWRETTLADDIRPRESDEGCCRKVKTL